ncbi:MAG: efflux RND transporter periplasmic adaptor subunit [Rhodoferax sp.]
MFFVRPRAEIVNPKEWTAALRWIATLAGVSLVAACGGKTNSGPVPAASAAGAGTPVAVTTSLARQRDFDVNLQAIGTVAAVSSVDVKPQTTSVLTRVHVQEGQFVRAGDLLFSLDARADEANVAKTRAQMAKDEAVLADAQRQLARSRDLVAKNFVSQGALDTSQALVESQLATVAADRAALNAAELSLSYTRVKASGAGRLGAVNVYAGTAVQANQTTLVTITQLDPVYVAFSLPQSNLEAALAGLKSGGIRVTARLPEGKGAVEGRLQFVDSAVDAATGTVKAKARFDNREAKLWPGAFVNVELTAGTLKDAVVIPMASIIQSTRGPIVYVVQNGKAVVRKVQVLASQAEDAAVNGVQGGDRVVLEGRQNLRPDSAVVERTAGPAKP